MNAHNTEMTTEYKRLGTRKKSTKEKPTATATILQRNGRMARKEKKKVQDKIFRSALNVLTERVHGIS